MDRHGAEDHCQGTHYQPGSNCPACRQDDTHGVGGACAAHLQLLEAAVCDDAATPQDQDAVAAGQVVPLVSHQQPRGPLQGALPLSGPAYGSLPTS